MSLNYLTIDGTTESKENIAIARIKAHVNKLPYYLAFSGGKDSVVILDLTKRSSVSFEPHYHYTTVDPPELTRFIRERYPEITWDRPKESMFRLIEKKGFPPSRQIRYCCEKLKEYGGEKGQIIITGVRWEEGISRSKREIFHPDTRGKPVSYLNPIIDWTSKEVWEYIKKYSLPYCPLYDEGFDRIGCIMCPLATREKRLMEAERWPKFKQAYLGAMKRGLVSHMGRIARKSGTTGEEMMSWWLYGDATICAEQCQLFG